MNIVPSNEYLLVMPSGNVKGFDDYAMAKAYINNYYYYKTRRVEEVGAYDDSATLDGLTVAHIAGIFPSIFHPNWGQGASIEEVWSGIIALTGDNLPFVGRLGKTFTGRNVQNLQRNSKGTEDSGEWIAAGWSGEGMVWAWLAGSALGIMIAGREKEELPEVAGRPGGALASWLPEELLVTSKRLRSADISRLASQM